MVKRGVVTALLLIATGLAQPARATEVLEGQQGVGLYTSNLAGSGLTYRHPLGNGLGLRVSGIGWSRAGSSYLELGGALTRDIARAPHMRAYGLLGVGTGQGYFWPLSALGSPTGTFVSYVGPGLGFEYHGLTLEFGLTLNVASSMVTLLPGLGVGWLFGF